MYYNARYYDAALGRFTQPDTIVPNPLIPQTLNRYAYTLNNPIRYTDPTGHCTNAKYTAGGCPSWMPDFVYGGLELVVNLTVSSTAFAPAEEGQPNNISDLEKSAGERWYQGAVLGLVDPFDYAQTADQCLNGDCDAWRIGGTVLPVVSGGMVKKVGPGIAETIKDLPEQIHHVAAWQNPKYTKQFEKILKDFDLNLNGTWNKIEDFPHKRGWSGGGGHPDAYHEWVLEQMRGIAKEAGKSRDTFLELWEERVKSVVEQNPEMLFDEWWR